MAKRRAEMRALDVEALLAKNPQVDREEIVRALKDSKIVEPGQILGRPYGGRRLLVDEVAKLEDSAPRRPLSFHRAF
jgi:hypothetical protein